MLYFQFINCFMSCVVGRASEQGIKLTTQVQRSGDNLWDRHQSVIRIYTYPGLSLPQTKSFHADPPKQTILYSIPQSVFSVCLFFIMGITTLKFNNIRYGVYPTFCYG